MARKFRLKHGKKKTTQKLPGKEAQFFVLFTCFWANAIAESVIQDNVCAMSSISPEMPCFNSCCEEKLGKKGVKSRKIDVNWLKRLGFVDDQLSQLFGKPICNSCHMVGYNMWAHDFTNIADRRPLKRKSSPLQTSNKGAHAEDRRVYEPEDHDESHDESQEEEEVTFELHSELSDSELSEEASEDTRNPIRKKCLCPTSKLLLFVGRTENLFPYRPQCCKIYHKREQKGSSFLSRNRRGRPRLGVEDDG